VAVAQLRKTSSPRRRPACRPGAPSTPSSTGAAGASNAMPFG
jgi:hypothetical protein